MYNNDNFIEDEVLPRKAKALIFMLNLKEDAEYVEINLFTTSKLLKVKPSKVVRYFLLLHAMNVIELINYDLDAGIANIKA